MGVARVDDAGGIAHQADEHPGLRIAEQLLAKERPPDLLVEVLLPRQTVGIEGEELAGGHGVSPSLRAWLRAVFAGVDALVLDAAAAAKKQAQQNGPSGGAQHGHLLREVTAQNNSRSARPRSR